MGRAQRSRPAVRQAEGNTPMRLTCVTGESTVLYAAEMRSERDCSAARRLDRGRRSITNAIGERNRRSRKESRDRVDRFAR